MDAGATQTFPLVVKYNMVDWGGKLVWHLVKLRRQEDCKHKDCEQKDCSQCEHLLGKLRLFSQHWYHNLIYSIRAQYTIVFFHGWRWVGHVMLEGVRWTAMRRTRHLDQGSVACLVFEAESSLLVCLSLRRLVLASGLGR